MPAVEMFDRWHKTDLETKDRIPASNSNSVHAPIGKAIGFDTSDQMGGSAPGMNRQLLPNDSTPPGGNCPPADPQVAAMVEMAGKSVENLTYGEMTDMIKHAQGDYRGWKNGDPLKYHTYEKVQDWHVRNDGAAPPLPWRQVVIWRQRREQNGISGSAPFWQSYNRQHHRRARRSAAGPGDGVRGASNET